MSTDMDKILQELHSLPDLKMDPQRKKEVLANIMEADVKWGTRSQNIRRVSIIAKGLVACSLFAGAVWAGSQFFVKQGNMANLSGEWTNTQVAPPGSTHTPDGPTSAPSGSTQTPVNSAVTQNDPQAVLLQKIKKLALQGKVINVEYPVENTVIDNVEKAWGKPDKHEFIGGISYDTYYERGVVFGSNKGMQIIDIRSYAPELLKIPISKVNQVLGKPDSIADFPGQVIYIYNVNEKYQLKIIFPLPTNEQPNPTIDHISVYLPRGAVNLMAENQSGKEVDSQVLLLQRTLDLARQGRVINSEFAAEKIVFDVVEQVWGKPDKQEYIYETGLTYAPYSKRGVVFGFNKGMQIADVRSYDPELLKIRLSKVQQVLGKANSIRNFSDQVIYVYNVNDKFQLKVIFPKPSKETPDPHIDHISVLYPRGTINMMAH